PFWTRWAIQSCHAWLNSGDCSAPGIACGGNDFGCFFARAPFTEVEDEYEGGGFLLTPVGEFLLSRALSLPLSKFGLPPIFPQETRICRIRSSSTILLQKMTPVSSSRLATP